MSDENVLLANGEKANNNIDAQSDEERLAGEDATADTQDPPQYGSTNETSTHQNVHNTTRIVGKDSQYHSTSDSSEISSPGANDTKPSNKALPSFSEAEITAAYFTAIKEGDTALMTSLLTSGQTTPSSPNSAGLTPLLAAIDAGRTATARLLLEAGADANAYGVVGRRDDGKGKPRPRHLPPAPEIRRTPLQHAAARGNLVLVRLLMETYGADDSLVAPDGELALRLAAARGHREVVAYLPARRGGGFRRWKVAHEAALRRARGAVEGIATFAELVGYQAPKFFFWTLPKHLVVLPVAKRVRWLWRHRGELPRLVAERLRRFWGAVREFPRNVWDFARRVPALVRRFLSGVYDALGVAAGWVWRGMRVLAGAVFGGFDRLFSALHTLVVAVGTFFKNATLKDVWDGFVAFLRAVGVDGPKKLWRWLRGLGDVIMNMLEVMWGDVGQVLGWISWGLFRAVVYLPRKLWEILASMFNSIGHGGEEVLIWINPKRQ
ncbi:hypothetical protein F5Y12DRAFT_795267 [Xylaria sp. FL1777]|nr:hypothetical protein F5Y12DRAFT_795267 [Xylaria sp. FL1777]